MAFPLIKLPDEIIFDDVSYMYNDNSDIKQTQWRLFNHSDKLKSDRSAGTVNKDYNFNKLKEYMDGKVSADTDFRLPLMKLPELVSVIETRDPKRSNGLDGITPKDLSPCRLPN